MINRCLNLEINRFLESRPPKGTIIENSDYCNLRKCDCKFVNDPDSCLDYEELFVRAYYSETYYSKTRDKEMV